MTRTFLQMLTAGGCLAAAAIGPAVAADISGAGATFPFPIYAKWADAYKKETGVGIAYQPVGSSDGIRQIQDREVTLRPTCRSMPRTWTSMGWCNSRPWWAASSRS